jgi:hypothetical protein
MQTVDPKKTLSRRADVTVDAECEDENGVYWSGEAFFITGGESITPDSGSSYWATDVQFVGAVLFSDDNATLVVHGHEGCEAAWRERALEAA